MHIDTIRHVIPQLETDELPAIAAEAVTEFFGRGDGSTHDLAAAIEARAPGRRVGEQLRAALPTQPATDAPRADVTDHSAPGPLEAGDVVRVWMTPESGSPYPAGRARLVRRLAVPRKWAIEFIDPPLAGRTDEWFVRPEDRVIATPDRPAIGFVRAVRPSHRLYHPVDADDIAGALTHQAGFAASRDDVALGRPIQVTGRFVVTVTHAGRELAVDVRVDAPGPCR